MDFVSWQKWWKFLKRFPNGAAQIYIITNAQIHHSHSDATPHIQEHVHSCEWTLHRVYISLQPHPIVHSFTASIHRLHDGLCMPNIPYSAILPIVCLRLLCTFHMQHGARSVCAYISFIALFRNFNGTITYSNAKRCHFFFVLPQLVRNVVVVAAVAVAARSFHTSAGAKHIFSFAHSGSKLGNRQRCSAHTINSRFWKTWNYLRWATLSSDLRARFRSNVHHVQREFKYRYGRGLHSPPSPMTWRQIHVLFNRN